MGGGDEFDEYSDPPSVDEETGLPDLNALQERIQVRRWLVG